MASSIRRRPQVLVYNASFPFLNREECERVKGQLSAISKDMMANLLLAAGGRSDISTGGGGSNGELTNWDGTKKKTGWEM